MQNNKVMRLNRFHASSATLIAVVSLYFTVAFNIAFYKKVVELNGGADWFVYSLPVLLFFLLNGVFQLLAAPLLHKVIIPALLVIGAAISYQSLFFNIYFDKHMLTNVLITGWAESSRLMTPAYLGWIAVLGVVPALLYLMVKVDYRRWYKEIALPGLRLVLPQQPGRDAPDRADQPHRGWRIQTENLAPGAHAVHAAGSGRDAGQARQSPPFRRPDRG